MNALQSTGGKTIRQSMLVFTCILVFLSLSMRTAHAATDVPVFSALDTIVGFGTQLKAQGLTPQKNYSVVLRKPDRAEVRLSGETDARGALRLEVSEEQTHISGTYEFIYEGRAVAAFEVFPGETSGSTSGMYVNRTSVPADSVSTALVSVRVTDSFSNPLAYHEVRLTSSRSADRVTQEYAETDEDGVATFTVASSSAGVSTLTATDETARTAISKRVRLTFTQTERVFKEVGGDPETVLLAQNGAAAARFEIENLPASIEANMTTSFRVRVVDGTGATVTGYSGTVIFSSTDSNAQLPIAYTFQLSNQGQKTFDLGLTFRTAGTHKLTVQEQGNALVKGEKSIEVVTALSGGTGAVRITKPATGTYSVNSLEIAGEVSPNASVRIFDNGQQIAEVTAQSSGRFSYTTSLLSDGQHTFHVESAGTQSSAVTVTIDSTPAQVEHVALTKTSLAPGDTTELSIRSDPNLHSIKATFGDLIIDLEADPQNPGLYRGTLTAPAQEGEYRIEVLLTDAVGNTSPAVEVATVRVDTSLASSTGIAFSVPSKVQQVDAFPGNGRVALTWTPASAEAGIALYRIYYGTNSNQLTLIVNTQGPVTQWYVPNLQNGTEYFFQVVGIDTRGNEGDNRSAVVRSTPSADALNGSVPVLCDPSPCPDAGYPPFTPEDGPGVVGMVVASLLASAGVRLGRRFGKW